MNWLVDQNVGEIFECNVKIRYRSIEIPARVRVTSSESVDVELDITKKPDITPGQIAVFYQKELCMGGGIIV
jgi:tRNA-specific 2-thiouridylase